MLLKYLQLKGLKGGVVKTVGSSILIDKVTREIAEKATQNRSENYCLIVPEKFSVTMEKWHRWRADRNKLPNLPELSTSVAVQQILPLAKFPLQSFQAVQSKQGDKLHLC